MLLYIFGMLVSSYPLTTLLVTTDLAFKLARENYVRIPNLIFFTKKSKMREAPGILPPQEVQTGDFFQSKHSH